MSGALHSRPGCDSAGDDSTAPATYLVTVAGSAGAFQPLWLLPSKAQIILFWGPEFVCIYNDAYRPIFGIGARHPWALGKPGADAWDVIWSVLGPLLEGVVATVEALPHLFERFFRVEGSEGRTHEGSGIGLALVQELATLHGGTVRASSLVGHGSTFTVSLPLGSSHLPHERIAAPRTLASTAVGASSFVQEALRWHPDSGRASDGLHLSIGEIADGRPVPADLEGAVVRIGEPQGGL